MSANVHGKMVYSFEKPMWHNITQPSLEAMEAEEVYDKLFGGGFQIHLRPVTVTLNDAQVETGDFAIVRGVTPYEDSERVFGYCSERFHPLQPREVAQCFDSNVCEPAETMGFLGHGEDMFISWKMPTIEVKVNDEVELFGIVRTGFDTLNGTRLFTSIYRPVCANTINLAEGWAKSHTDKNGKGSIWKGRGVNKNLLRDLGYWMEHVQGKALAEAQLLENFFVKLADTPIHSINTARFILEEAYPNTDDVSEYYPKQLRADKEQKIADFNESQADVREGILNLFSGEGTGITPDFWGLLNATSEYFCHVQASKKPIAESVMFGGRQKNIMKMVTRLSNLVN